MAEPNAGGTISRRILRRLGKTLDNPQQILVAFRSELTKQSKAAFKDQRFGEIIWPARYPAQAPPKLNIAGAVQDLASGPRIKARRWQDRPALLDKGATGLQGSINSQIVGDEVVTGTTKEYAINHQVGKPSKQTITPTIKANLKQLLKFEEFGKTKTGKARKVNEKTAVLRKKLGFLFGITELTTKPHARPFLGLTDSTKKRCEQIIEDVFGAAGAVRVH
jgi:phage gpG-like protein